MFRLRRADLVGILGFLADVNELESDTSYPIAILARLQDLIACDGLGYQEIDVPARRFGTTVCFPTHPEDHEEDDRLYWTVGPCPICDYRDRTGDLSAVRMSDVISRARYHELPVYREYHQPGGIRDMMDVGLPAGPGRHRSFLLCRGSESSAFSERDRDVLEALRPHFRALEVRASLRRQLSEALTTPAEGRPTAYTGLTTREREIVDRKSVV